MDAISRVELDFEQRRRASILENYVSDDEYATAAEIVHLRDSQAELLAALRGTRMGLSVLLCFASSPRFQMMTLSEVIAELQANNAWPGDVAAGLTKLDAVIAKAEGR